jgi:hypothetical protein
MGVRLVQTAEPKTGELGNKDKFESQDRKYFYFIRKGNNKEKKRAEFFFLPMNGSRMLYT